MPVASSIRRSILAAALLLAILFSALGLSDRVLDACGLAFLDQTNQRYLDDAFEKALTGFIILSGIKSGLAIIEGSEVGVGFNLQIGDVVQPLYDYVDIAWQAALTGGSIIGVMQLALDGLDIVDQWALTLFFVIALIAVLIQWLKPGWQGMNQSLKQTFRFLLMLCLSLYLFLPLAITAATALSRHITAPMVEETHARLKALGDDLSPEQINRRLFPDSNASGSGFFDLWGRLDP